MVILGLTGSIAMGKTTASRAFARLGIPVFDADAAVHTLLAPGGKAVAVVLKVFPGVEAKTAFGIAVDRAALGRQVFNDPAALKVLEGILHPMVRLLEQRFLRQAARQGRKLVVLDIPLLLESGTESRCDIIAVVSAPAFLQRQRALARPGMTPARLAAILARQMPDSAKRRRADYVIQTGLGRAFSFAAIRRIVVAVTSRTASRGLSNI